VRDFRGISPKGFDGRGNYTLGLRDQLIFPEIDYMKVDKNRGMNISVVTTAKTNEDTRTKIKEAKDKLELKKKEKNLNDAQKTVLTKAKEIINGKTI
jgi:ribosomal protein L5